jgi:RNA polymerase sigma factor (sigma-70 family)
MNDAATIEKEMPEDHKQNITQSIKEYSRRLMAFVKQRVAGEEDAEDILQDVFYQFAAATEPIEQTGKWLFTVARNKITDSYRKHRLPLADDLFLGGGEDDEVFDWREFLLAGDSNSETDFLRSLFWEELSEALDELPEEQRNVFIQNEIEDIPFREIAAAKDVSVATLISRKRYAVLHLRKRLKELRDELLDY